MDEIRHAVVVQRAQSTLDLVPSEWLTVESERPIVCVEHPQVSSSSSARRAHDEPSVRLQSLANPVGGGRADVPDAVHGAR
jgi:hypothetical protein